MGRRLRAGDADAVGPAGSPRDRQPARLADDRRADARRARRAGAVRERDPRTRAAATSCCSAWAAPRSRPRCCDARSAREPGRPRLHVLDSTDAATVARRAGPSISSARCSSSPRSPAGRSSRCRCSPTSARSSATGKRFVAITDPGSGLEKLAHEHGFRRRVRRRPGHRRALQRAVAVRDRAGGADRGRHARAARGRAGVGRARAALDAARAGAPRQAAEPPAAPCAWEPR